MYVPKHFELGNQAAQMDLIRQNSFATLVTGANGTMTATHLPLLLENDASTPTLVGHMARMNDQWRQFDEKIETMAVFQGPHAYISPNWYATPNRVPTWNYTAVHVYGMPQIIDDPEQVIGVLEQMVSTFESDATGNWSMDTLEPKAVTAMMRGIVTFRIPIQRLDAKHKLSQDKTDLDIAGAIAGLRKQNDPQALKIADLMDSA